MTLAKPKKIKKPARPTRDEFELEDIANSLSEAHNEKLEVILNVWKRDEPVQGVVAKMDGNTKLIHIEQFTETLKIPFKDIMNVQNV